LLPSAIHRSDVWVGIETPTVVSPGFALLPFDEPPPPPPPAPLPPHAARLSASAALTAAKPSLLLTADLLLRDI
jgi:hypothetical protein